MKRIRCRVLPAFSAMVAFLATVAACGDDSSLVGVQDDLAFLVGDWMADVLVATGIENPELTRDLLAEGADFRINVQPSGVYTATLTVSGRPFTEIGRLSLDGEDLTFFVDFPVPDTTTGTLVQLGQDRVRLLGETSVDLDFDLVPEDAALRTELVRDES